MGGVLWALRERPQVLSGVLGAAEMVVVCVRDSLVGIGSLAGGAGTFESP